MPGLQRRLLVDPEVVRAVSLVTVAGRRYSPVVAAFIRAIRSHRWPQDAEAVLPARNVGRPAELERAAPPR